MTFQIHNFTDNDDITTIAQIGVFSVIEYAKDLSVDTASAQRAFFESQMNVRRKQLVIGLQGGAVTVQAGAMQWTAGRVSANTGVKGAGDFIGKMFRGAVTGESAIKPEYSGTGLVVLEPTTRHIILQDLAQWGGGLVVEDGMFLACDAGIEHKLIARSNLSSAVGGGEGLFNLGLFGSGVVALECAVPAAELIAVDLNEDELRIDGPLAVAWSPSLQFTVERSGRSLIGSMASGEGLVNVYRGTGRVLMSPVAATNLASAAAMSGE
ncbi:MULTISPECIES: AIM24 family protein [Schaalia]|uniref:AIM24 family protein n=1 Tax=Schaalia TaxID=2529408 RepID=UPI001F2DC8F8|nr:AIM24 family protein [Schaalia hyovaginalis]MCF2711411.1 AIM24 family protein [Schaalia hyovaginalis]MCI6557966.1 AIM24 family protein [Schaalia hyovaginalis]MCI7512131.1 AIM24 family protein [Schaalia hyovaginalis]MDD7554724.1 AIM24 family protein [Schaalia hyovaginalis]MDY3094406.1 AIM24 family protein [Schaalia hyovaginalis]